MNPMLLIVTASAWFFFAYLAVFSLWLP